jgi:hypothetical protein
VTEGLLAAQWMAAGVMPTTVQTWREAGIEASEAVRWHEMGYGLEAARAEKRKGLGPEQAFAQSNPRQLGGSGFASRVSVASSRWVSRTGTPMQAFHQSGVDSRVMHGYMQRQWFDEDAKAWALQGIEAADAYTWHELGLTPVEAGRLAMQGRTPGEVIGEWWGAGVPFDEVAEWIGAGLSSAEALEQRSRGITADHAAALRALRQQEIPPPRDSSVPPTLISPQGPPGSERSGPPPENEEEARAEVVDAFGRMLDVNDEDGSIQAVDGGSNLGAPLAEAGQRHGVGPDPLTRTVSVDSMRFINDHEARVVYSVMISGPFSGSPMLRGRPGRAILVDGEWKVARETFCLFLQMAGVECPPRDENPPS